MGRSLLLRWFGVIGMREEIKESLEGLLELCGEENFIGDLLGRQLGGLAISGDLIRGGLEMSGERG